MPICATSNGMGSRGMANGARPIPLRERGRRQGVCGARPGGSPSVSVHCRPRGCHGNGRPRGFTRDLMRQMELDLATRLDWIAVDHHNTGHPHTHIIVRGVLDDGRILNIAGDYIAHGVRHRASELVTRELGHQSEIELQTKLQNEVEAERVTRLDKMLLSEQHEQGVIDLRPGEGATSVRENRNLMIGRVRFLERYGWPPRLSRAMDVSDRADKSLEGS